MTRFWGIAALTTLCLSGCGGDGATGGAEVFSASGSVKMFGSPLPGATVAFAPQDGQPTAIGTTDKDGNFVLTTYDYGDGAAEGKYKVVISKSAAAAATEGGDDDGHGDGDFVDPSNSGSHAAGEGTGDKGLVPAQYTSSAETPLSAEVKSGSDNTFNFEIN